MNNDDYCFPKVRDTFIYESHTDLYREFPDRRKLSWSIYLYIKMQTRVMFTIVREECITRYRFLFINNALNEMYLCF